MVAAGCDDVAGNLPVRDLELDAMLDDQQVRICRNGVHRHEPHHAAFHGIAVRQNHIS